MSPSRVASPFNPNHASMSYMYICTQSSFSSGVCVSHFILHRLLLLHHLYSFERLLTLSGFAIIQGIIFHRLEFYPTRARQSLPKLLITKMYTYIKDDHKRTQLKLASVSGVLVLCCEKIRLYQLYIRPKRMYI